MKQEGQGGPQDDTGAYELYSLAAAQGCVDSKAKIEEADRVADVLADVLVAEEEAEKLRRTKSKEKKKKKKNKPPRAVSALPVVDEATMGQGAEKTGDTICTICSLEDAGDITGRVPESTLGGETTCIVCFDAPKSHMAFPCCHRCVCGPCSENGKINSQCPYCRAAVTQWCLPRDV